MATIRQGNWLGQARVDVRDFRAMESAVAADFDIFSGRMFAGERPLVLDGMTVPTSGLIGAPASSLQVDMTGAMLIHFGASVSGSIFAAPADRGLETISSTNSRVSGSWASGATNYLGVSLVRRADSTTSDIVKFFVPDTDSEIGKTVPLAKTVDYIFVVSTVPFSAQTTILPVAKVTVDSTGNITGVVDAREMCFRLGRGGDLPSREGFPWPEARSENYGGSPFAGGDKGISSLKDWMDAAMTRIWEIGGGEAWYSGTADRNVNMIWTGTTFSNGENFEWDGADLHWKGLRFLFDNSTGTYNDVADQTVNSTGLTNLADGECLYVDLDRSANRTGGTALVAAKAALTTLGTGSTPGARTILAWRVGSNVYTRNWRYAVGQTFTAATTSSLGVVQLNQTPGSSSNPVVVSIMSNGEISVTGGTSTIAAATFTNGGSGPGMVGNSGTSSVSYLAVQAGVLGYGANGAAGTAARQLGRHGLYGLGGTGSAGGAGAIFQGGAGDVLLNANAIGGAGSTSNGGAGVGTGAGGAGQLAAGGLAGDGITRAPAFKSSAGPVEIPTADTYRYDTTNTGSIFIPASDFLPTSGGGATPPISSAEDGAGVSAFGSETSTTMVGAKIPLPRGAEITQIFVHGTNNHASNTYAMTVNVRRKTWQGSASPFSSTNIYSAASASITPSTVSTWIDLGAASSAPLPQGRGTSSGAGGYVHVSITLPATAVAGNLLFEGLYVVYAYRNVDFMV